MPRTDVVYIERHKNLRQTMSLFLRSGFSRVPVIGENLDDVVGIAYLKDLVRRDFEAPDVEFTQRVEEVMRPAHFVPDSKPVDALLSRDAGDADSTSPSSSTSTAAPPAWSRSRTCWRRSSARSPTSTTPRRSRSSTLDDGCVRVSSRYPVDDLDELFGFDVEDEDVDSVGGLMAKHLGKVPIPGSHGGGRTGCASRPRSATGRRNKIGTVLIRRRSETDPDAAGYAGAHD